MRRFGPISFETSNEAKVLFPRTGQTKGDLIAYYERIAGRILPHLKGRPLVVQRYPDGIDGEGFYQKQIGDHYPGWVSRVRVPLRSREAEQELVVCENVATLVYLANQACITLHPWLSRRDHLDRPDQMIIDLDPPEDDFEAVRVAALRVRALFEALDLPTYPKLTGSKGVHVVIPLRVEAGFDVVRDFARTAMEILAARYPDELTTEQRKDRRGGRLYLDVGRNAYGQTSVAPWSVRAREEAPVATPIPWSALQRRGLGARDYTMENVFVRTAQRDDPWPSMRRHACSLEPRMGTLARLR